MFNDQQLKINAARSQKIQDDIASYQAKGGKIYKAQRGESAYKYLFYSFDSASSRLTEKK